MRSQIVFLTGESGAGKDFFFDNIMPIDNNGAPIYHALLSMTTRKPRDGEQDGVKYNFVDEKTFFDTKRATTLFVNESIYRFREKIRKELENHKCSHGAIEYIEYIKTLPSLSDGDRVSISKLIGTDQNIHKDVIEILRDNPKWLYGVPELEMDKNKGRNLSYNVIQPRYVRQMIDWMEKNNFDYKPKILWFQKPENNLDIAANRANMAADLNVRTANTCNLSDFYRAGLRPDFSPMSVKDEAYYPMEMVWYFNEVAKEKHGLRTQTLLPENLKFRMPKDMVLSKLSNESFYTRRR